MFYFGKYFRLSRKSSKSNWFISPDKQIDAKGLDMFEKRLHLYTVIEILAIQRPIIAVPEIRGHKPLAKSQPLY